MEKRLQEIEARKAEIRSLLESDEDVDLDKINEELRSLEAEEKELRSRMEIAAGIETGAVPARVVASTRRAEVQAPEVRAEDPYGTVEYRQAFMDYVTRGTRSNLLEFRQDQTTRPEDVGAVIPTTIMDRIVQRMEEIGRIWSRVTKTSYPGGLQIPVATVRPTAVWVATQGAGANDMAPKQKLPVNASIIFAYHKLQVRVSVDLIASVVTLPMFEAHVSNNVADAMVIALEKAILSGSGTGEPKGYTAYKADLPAAQVVEVSPSEFGKYATWPRLLGAVPRMYRNRSVILMADPDWTRYIEGMVDDAGQPVARVTYGLDGNIQERFLGREVIPLEDGLPSIDEADVGDVVAVVTRLDDYLVNSNMGITYRRYFDEDSDEWVSKSTMIADGKLADPNGVVLIVKKDDPPEL